MWSKPSRRILSLLLALVLTAGLLPAISMPALAAEVAGTLSAPGIGLSADDNRAWSAAGGSMHGEVTGSDYLFWTSSSSSTLILRNNKLVEATLSFDYRLTLNGGSATIDRESATTDGHFSKVLKPEEAVEIAITSQKGKYTTKIDLDNILLLAMGAVQVTFQPAEGGSYTVNEQAVDASGLTMNQDSSFAYQLKASPEEGYAFLGWRFQEGGAQFTGPTATLYFDQDRTVTPWFVPEETAVFSAGGSYYTRLDEALSAAASGGGVVAVTHSGTLTAGDYTIPSGVTLLVPFDSDNTLCTTSPKSANSYSKPALYRRLTLSPGANITVADGGAISVGGSHTGAMDPGPGSPSGPYGQLQMEDGSSIRIQSGGKLYAYGFVTGSGTVTALDGAEVWEYFQITDWRGGTASLGMAGNQQRVFPFSQYYIQNIETPLTVCSGAREMLYTSIGSRFGTQSAQIEFVGEHGLFKLSGADSSFQKQYLPEQDRLQMDFQGNVSINEISVSLFSSGSYVLPINSNISIRILSGTASIDKDLSVLPGAEVSVAQGAEMVIPENRSLFLYDAGDWIGQKYVWPRHDFRASSYSPTRSHKRTQEELTSSRLDVNGTVTVAGGLYTTAPGAAITSSQGSGKLLLRTAPDPSKALYQATQENTKIHYHQVPVSPAVLHNADESTTDTAGAAADSCFSYDAAAGNWSVQEHRHSYGGWERDENTHWRACPCGDKTDLAAHTFVWKVDQPATEAASGLKHEECSVCGYRRSEGTVIDPLPHTHTEITHHAAVPATCHSAGSVEYWTCSSPQCAGTYYGDAACSTVLPTIETPVDPNNHDGKRELRNGKAATCENPGYTGDLYCLECGRVITGGTSIPPLNHAWGKPEFAWSRDSRACTVTFTCTTDPSHRQQIQAQVSSVVKTPATCTRKGEHTYTAAVTFLGQPYTERRDVADIDMLAHSYGNWQTSSTSHWKECSVCHDKTQEAPHRFTWVVDRPASGTTAGLKHEECSVCGYKRSEGTVIDPPVHAGGGAGGSGSSAAGGGSGGGSASTARPAAGPTDRAPITPKGGSASSAQLETAVSRAGKDIQNSHTIAVIPGSEVPQPPTNPYTDLSTGDYFYDAVLWATANGVTSGTGTGTFSPDAAVTRAQAVTFQWRAAGTPAVSGGSFADVTGDAYYSGAVSWAVANGITSGTGGNSFSPDTPVSRSQAVTFLYRELAGKTD